MQSKALLTASLVFAASSVADAQDSANDAFTTAPPSLDSQAPLSSIVDASYDSYEAAITTDPLYSALDDYFSSAPTAFVSEFEQEEAAYITQLPTTGSVELPALITALPSSLQTYASKILKDQANIINTLASANGGDESSATEKSPSATDKTRSSSSSNDTQTKSSSNSSGGPNSTSGASGSSTTHAPTGSGSSASRASSSSSTGNAEAQPTAALKVMGALVAGVIGLAAVA